MYKNSYSSYIKTSCLPFKKETVIQIERIDFASGAKLKQKYEDNILKYKKFIPEEVLQEIFDKIRESKRIPDDIKDMLGIYDW